VGRNNSAITGLISRMEEAGLVSRGKSPEDGRTKTVSLTGTGWSVRESVMNDFRAFNEKLVKGLTDAEIDAVMKFLALSVSNVGG